MTTAPAAGGARLPDAAYAAALTTLPQLGPTRLRALLHGACGDAAAAWRAVAEGRVGDDVLVRLRTSDPRRLAAQWRVSAGQTDPADVWAVCRAAGIGVVLEGSADYPEALAADPEPPGVLFVRGDLAALDQRRVAIVGTRRCTSSGALVARQLGAGLAEAGVAVVSGLALGIDGAAHTGALAVADAGSAVGSAPIGVVGSGLDVVYPSRHRRLWDDVARRGVLLGEAPPGARPERWRFPARKRILAALAEVVVVVESHARGGSLHTVDAAIERGVPVMAVPGSVRCPAAEGTNLLLAEGAPPVLDVRDVLVALGIPPRPRTALAGPRTATPLARALVAALDGGPAGIDELAARTGAAVTAVSTALQELRAGGLVSLDRGWWCRAVD